MFGAGAVGTTSAVACWAVEGLEAGVALAAAGTFAFAGALDALLKEAWLTGVMGVDGVGVAGGSASAAAGAFAVEFFLLGRYKERRKVSIWIMLAYRVRTLTHLLRFTLIFLSLGISLVG